MAKRTRTLALKLAAEIRQKLGAEIKKACEGTDIPPSFVAGLISVENAQLNPHAKRYEPHVFERLKAVRDGRLRSWSKVTTAQLKGASDAALKNLATSFGYGQVMGWHCINSLNCTVAELKGEGHMKYLVALLLLNSADGDFKREAYVGEYREWNSGSETGRTHDPDYVHNALAVMDAYEDIEPIDSEEDSAAPADTHTPFGEAARAADEAGDTQTSLPPPTPPLSLSEARQRALEASERAQRERTAAAEADAARSFDYLTPEEKPLDTEKPKSGEPVPDQPATVGEPVVGGRPEDPSVRVTNSRMARIYAGAGAVLPVIGAVWGWINGNLDTVKLCILCVTILGLALIFRNVALDIVRLFIKSDPARYNAK